LCMVSLKRQLASQVRQSPRVSPKGFGHVQVCTHCLLCSKVVNERSCYAQAAFLTRFATAACAIRLDRVEVFSERRVLEIEDPACSDSIPEPLKTTVIVANSFTHSGMLNLPLSLLAKRSRTCLPPEQSQQEDPLGSPERESATSRCPCAVHLTMPITYLGFISGRRSVQALTLVLLAVIVCKTHGSTHTLQKSSFASPPERPPIAMPGVSLRTISRQHSLLICKSSPP